MTDTQTNPSEVKDEDITHSSDDTKCINNTITAVQTTTSDPDLDALHAMSDDDQLWFFIDDVVPTTNKDTEVIICEDGVSPQGVPMLTLAPHSMEIFEEIANIPNHAASMYPNMVKYFSDIIRLYNTVVRQDINPYWSTEIMEPSSPTAIQILIGIQSGYKGYLSLTPKQNSIPVRLHYGDNSHKHDFVGIVYLYIT